MRRPLVRLGKVIFEIEKRLKTLDFTGFSASFKFRYIPLISSKIRRCITPWKPFAQKAWGFESLFLRQKIRTSLAGVLYFLPQSEALERPSVTRRVAEWGSHLSVSHRGACSPVAERKIFVKDEYPSSKPFDKLEFVCYAWKGHLFPIHWLFCFEWTHLMSPSSISTPRCSFENSTALMMDM